MVSVDINSYSNANNMCPFCGPGGGAACCIETCDGCNTGFSFCLRQFHSGIMDMEDNCQSEELQSGIQQNYSVLDFNSDTFLELENPFKLKGTTPLWTVSLDILYCCFFIAAFLDQISLCIFQMLMFS